MPKSYTMGFWTVRHGAEDDFVAAWTAFADWITGQPGVHTMRLVRDVKQPGRFISFADWDGMEEIHAWKASPEFKERIGRVKQYTDDFTAAEAELAVRVG
jgi:heme-degrading monooxygenase HmoA